MSETAKHKVRMILEIDDETYDVVPFFAAGLRAVRFEHTEGEAHRQHVVIQGMTDESFCTCPDNRYRGHDRPCKHREAARLFRLV